MSYVEIRNKGAVQIGAFSLLGASTKEGDNTKIGFFGSGNKYAIATLLRLGVPFMIYSGLEEIKISTRKVSLGDTEFDQILINGETTSFTTRMGPTWELWFALREFICNAIDEGGYEFNVVDEVGLIPDVTTIYIELTNEVKDFVDKIDEYILQSEPIAKVDTANCVVDIHEGNGDSFLYYRKGIRVSPPSTAKALFRYNFSNIDINESRIAPYPWQASHRIELALAETNDRNVIDAFLGAARSDYVESELEFGSCYPGLFSPTWREALDGKTLMREGLTDYAPREDISRCVVLNDNLVSMLSRAFEDIDIYGSRNGLNNNNFEPSEEDQKKLDKAIGIMETIGLVPGISNLKIDIVEFLNEDTIAVYTQKESLIQVSHRHLDDPFELIVTLYEEYMHYRGYSDGSRDFEQELMRIIVKKYVQAFREHGFFEATSKAIKAIESMEDFEL